MATSKDFDVIIFLLYTFMLNNSKDLETMEKMIQNIMTNLSESQLKEMHENRSSTLAKVFFQIGKQH